MRPTLRCADIVLAIGWRGADDVCVASASSEAPSAMMRVRNFSLQTPTRSKAVYELRTAPPPRRVVVASEVEKVPDEDPLLEGVVHVLRPMLLTATVAAIGFLPMVSSASAGREVQQPLATAVMDGIISSTF